jgi:hypothetical protein
LQAFASEISGQRLTASEKVELLEATVDHSFSTQSSVASVTKAVVGVSIGHDR